MAKGAFHVRQCDFLFWLTRYIREHFRTEAAIEAFWKSLPDDQRRELWGAPLDIAQEPFVREYYQWGRAKA